MTHLLTLETLRQEHRDRILSIAARRGVKNIRIFGSMARGEQTKESDIDFLYTRLPQTDLMDLGGLLWELEELLGRKVDIVSDTALSPHMRERVLQEAVPL